MKKTLPIIIIYFVIFSVFSLIYLPLFHTSLFGGQKVIFYRGTMLLGTSFVLTLFLIAVIHSAFIKKHLESMIAALLVAFSIHLSLFVVFPVTFERSVTMYLLNTLKDNQQNTCQGLTKEQMKGKLINEYVVGKDAVNKRINEQTIIDMINKKDNCFQLTTRGTNFLELSEILKKVYNIR